ncbi:protein FAM210A [Bombina bombina]|uniref:protein FAM210A n=1 Tax=Bombina bombina TaxID=8345 RepID=UPI00235A5C41|nr:protein FAM210A [Bombina bombina]XP_053570862.1 protein FAM210A [Bombina bombina]
MRMYLLKTFVLRSNATSALRESRTIKWHPFSPRYGCQAVVLQRQGNHWIHSPPGQDISQEKKAPYNPTPKEDAQQSQDKSHLSTVETPDAVDADPLQDKSIGLFQRFKKTFKQYGKVLIPVHLVTSSIWFGSFYYAAIKGVNVVPFLEFIGLPEVIVNILKNSQSGNALTAYALYKIATPARYTVTLGGTSISVKYLRKYGYLTTPPLVKDYLQDRMEETKGLFTEKMEETRDIISGKMEETKDRISEKLQETKDKVSFRKKKE